MLDWLRETFGEKFISFKTDRIWPPHSPDLSSTDFFLWGYLKDKVYNPKPDTLKKLEVAICIEMRKITSEICMNVIENFKRDLTS